MICGKGVFLVLAGRLAETEMTELPEAENSTGWLQQPKMSDDRRLTAGMIERAVGVIATNEVCNGQADQRHEPADSRMAEQGHAAHQAP